MLEQERRALEEAKREAAVHLAKQWQKQQQEHRHQRQPQPPQSDTEDDEDEDEDDSLEEVLNNDNNNNHTRPKKTVSRKKKLQRLRRLQRRRRRRGGGGIPRSPTIDESDFAFMDDLSHLLRESGLLSGCVGQCFGGHDDGSSSDDPTMAVPRSEDSTSTGNPSVGSPGAAGAAAGTNKNDSMNMLYAKYRE
jgi:hypothetical protein